MIDQLRIGKTNMASVALALCMSEATLRRRLIAESTSFSRLLEQARERLAKRYLSDLTLSLDDVSNLMGFRSLRELESAFAGWCRCTPEQFRAERAAPEAAGAEDAGAGPEEPETDSSERRSGAAREPLLSRAAG